MAAALRIDHLLLKLLGDFFLEELIGVCILPQNSSEIMSLRRAKAEVGEGWGEKE